MCASSWRRSIKPEDCWAGTGWRVVVDQYCLRVIPDADGQASERLRTQSLEHGTVLQLSTINNAQVVLIDTQDPNRYRISSGRNGGQR